MVCLLIFLVPHSFASEAKVKDEVTTSPRGTFEIVQHYEGDWTQSVRFIHASARTVILEQGISWPARYYISPDARWILRVQKSGSGDNISFLYHLDDHGQLSRKEERIGELGFAYLARQSGVPHDLYHTGIEFESWDLKAGLMRFIIIGSDSNHSGNVVRRSLAYNLRAGTIAALRHA